MKWHIVAAMALAVAVGACAQLDRVVDACMDGVMGPDRVEVPRPEPSVSSSFNPAPLSLAPSSPGWYPPPRQ